MVYNKHSWLWPTVFIPYQVFGNWLHFYHHTTGCHYNKTWYLLFILSSTLLASVGMEHRATVHAVPTWLMVIQPARTLKHKRCGPIVRAAVRKTNISVSCRITIHFCHIGSWPLSNYEQCHLLLRRLKLILTMCKRLNSSPLRASSVSNKKAHRWLPPRGNCRLFIVRSIQNRYIHYACKIEKCTVKTGGTYRNHAALKG
jgi:hypothetical protein